MSSALVCAINFYLRAANQLILLSKLQRIVVGKLDRISIRGSLKPFSFDFHPPDVCLLAVFAMTFSFLNERSASELSDRYELAFIALQHYHTNLANRIESRKRILNRLHALAFSNGGKNFSFFLITVRLFIFLARRLALRQSYVST